MRLARELIIGIGDPAKRSFLKTIIQSLLNRAREGAAKTKWDRQEYHRSMVDNLAEMQSQFERVTSALNDSEKNEHILATAEEIASLLRTDVKIVETMLESGELDGFRIGNDWRVRSESIIDFLKNRITDQRMKSLIHNLQKPEVWARELRRIPELKKQIAVPMKKSAVRVGPHNPLGMTQIQPSINVLFKMKFDLHYQIILTLDRKEH